MKIDSPIPTYIGYEVNYFTNEDLIKWVIEYLPVSEYFNNDSDLVELISLNTKDKLQVEKAGVCLTNFVCKQWPEFKVNNSKAEIYAKKYFKARLKEYLAGQCRPYDVCKMINPIEHVWGIFKR